MASSLIHIAVAKELNKILKKNEQQFLLGSIAPDIAKLLNKEKKETHFITIPGSDIPNLNLFLSKYGSNINDSFVLGYYVHLYTDYLWFKYFITEILLDKETIKTLDNKVIHLNDDEVTKYIYNDYTNLNINLITNYDIDIEIFYNSQSPLQHIITEFDYNSINALLEQLNNIIENSKAEKAYAFKMKHIERFIKTSCDLILEEIKKVLN